MMLILRLHPKYELEKVWDFVDKEFKDHPSKDVLPLFASHAENRNHVSVLIETESMDAIADLLVNQIAKCEEITRTRTITLMKPAFFPVPRDIPRGMSRFMVMLSVRPKSYSDVYNNLIRMKRPLDIYFSYAAYSCGKEDVRISAIARDWDSLRAFVNKSVSTLKGVKSTTIMRIRRSMRLTTPKKWLEHQKKYAVSRLTGEPAKGGYEYDWTFIEHCTLHGALPDEI
ncbi:MAG: hypothetical protein ACE5KV_09255 [Thermoplasmata archaeon]